MFRTHINLKTAKRFIRDGDLLLFRRRGIIAAFGRSEYSHAAKAAWWGDQLFCLEVREWCGGRAVTLASQVRKHPSAIDVLRPGARWPQYDSHESTRYLKNLAGSDYGYSAVLLAALRHLPFVRLFVKPIDDADAELRPPFCSQACALADRVGGGVDPVPHLADRLTEPADLARSPFYEYLFTLAGE